MSKEVNLPIWTRGPPHLRFGGAGVGAMGALGLQRMQFIVESTPPCFP